MINLTCLRVIFSVLAAELTENAYAQGVPANATKLRRANWRL